jgi:hypothetical protein
LPGALIRPVAACGNANLDGFTSEAPGMRQCVLKMEKRRAPAFAILDHTQGIGIYVYDLITQSRRRREQSRKCD